jgi:hypothetical protein
LEPILQPTPEALAIAQVLGRSMTQTGRNIFDLSADSRVLLVFLRHAGCSFCREALSDLARARHTIAAAGTRIVLVHMGDTRSFETLLLKNGLSDLDRICDPDQSLYKAFGVRRGSLAQLFGPKVLWRAIPGGVLARHGIGVPGDDPAQMPAIFLISNSAIVRRFRHRSAADRPDYLSFCSGDSQAAD